MPMCVNLLPAQSMSIKSLNALSAGSHTYTISGGSGLTMDSNDRLSVTVVLRDSNVIVTDIDA